MNYIMEILTSNGGAFAIVIGLLGLAFWVIKKLSTIGAEHNSLNKSIGGLETNGKEIQKDIAYIKGMMELISKMNNNENSLTKSHSPISLTEKGKTISKELKIEEKININWEKIRNYLEANLKSKNAYDIQQFCIETAVVSLDNFFVEKDVNEVKNYVFKKGDSFAGYGNMIGVEIRDRYFKYKAIGLEDIDKYDPNK